MKVLIRPLAKPPTWLIALGQVLWVVYIAIYPDLNPHHLQIQDAIVQALAIIVSAIGTVLYAVEHAKQYAVATLDTRSIPAVQRSSLDDPPYH